MQNLAFARENVIVDVQPQHRFQMRANDGVGDDVRHFRDRARAGFNGVQRLTAPVQRLFVGRVIGRSSGVEIPAEIIEARPRGQLGDLGGRLVLEVMKADHDVGYLHARVVDVVLHLDLLAERAQHADEGVAQRGVPQMADVGRLVRVDVGVLDDDLFGGRARRFHDGRRLPAASRRHKPARSKRMLM